nr:hypothetical protein HmN_000503600 [Hymenolepis microstoma]
MSSTYGGFLDDVPPGPERSLKLCRRTLKLMVPKLRNRKRVRLLDLVRSVIEYIRYLQLILSEGELQTPFLPSFRQHWIPLGDYDASYFIHIYSET